MELPSCFAQDPVKKNQPVTEQNENKTDKKVIRRACSEDTVKRNPSQKSLSKDVLQQVKLLLSLPNNSKILYKTVPTLSIQGTVFLCYLFTFIES